MTENGAKRRRARRFQIPGGKVRLKRAGLFSLFQGFSGPFPVGNASKGGLALRTNERFRKGQKLTIQLLIPNEAPLNLKGEAWWQEEQMEGIYATTGIKFMPFGSKAGWNSSEVLEMLRKLEARYIK